MKDLLLTLLHLAVMIAKLCDPGGVRAVIAENLLLKQQLLVRRTFGFWRSTISRQCPMSPCRTPSWSA